MRRIFIPLFAFVIITLSSCSSNSPEFIGVQADGFTSLMEFSFKNMGFETYKKENGCVFMQGEYLDQTATISLVRGKYRRTEIAFLLLCGYNLGDNTYNQLKAPIVERYGDCSSTEDNGLIRKENWTIVDNKGETISIVSLETRYSNMNLPVSATTTMEAPWGGTLELKMPTPSYKYISEIRYSIVNPKYHKNI